MRTLLLSLAAAVAVIILPAPAQAITIDGYGWTPYAPVTVPCVGDRPGLTRFVQWLRENPAWTPTAVGTHSCRANPSAHREGRAVDWHLRAWEAGERARADDLIYTLLAHDVEGNEHSLLRRMGVMEIIWNNQYWSNQVRYWQTYTYTSNGVRHVCPNGDDTNCHRDHIHLTLNAAGASEQSSFWNAAYTQRSDSTFFVSDESTLTAAGVTVGRPIYGRPRDNALGLPGDKPIAGDWDGNGSTTIGVVRGNRWHLRNSVSTGRGEVVFGYGLASDTPIVGDWNGDRRQTPGVVRVENGQLRWYLRNSNSDGVADLAFSYGMPGDTPVVGDWNGDGIQTIGVVRAENGGLRWYLRNSNSQGVGDVAFGYGFAGDRPIVGDWNNDRRDTQGIARYDVTSSWCPNGNTLWKLSDTLGAGANRVFSYGCWADRPIAGDWNASGTDTVGVSRRF
jgi:hypothetical protein